MTVGASIIVTASLALAAVVFGCGAERGADTTAATSVATTTATADAGILTIEQALQAERGSTIKVRGALVAPNDGSVAEMVLASVLLESYPPQAGGATLGLKGLDLEDLVGLSSTSDRPDMAQVTWSDYWMVLGGVIQDGVLDVQETPRIVTTTAAGATLRFSPVGEPIASGETTWWAFDVKNPGSAPLELSFWDGQHVEVILAQGGVEKYRWSAGKAFTQAIEHVTIQPADTWSTVVNDIIAVPAGEYDLTAMITAGVSGAGTGSSSGNALPLLNTTIRVH